MVRACRVTIMPMLVRCTQCGRQGRVPDHLLGQQVRCPKCGAEFLAAAPAKEESVSAPEAGVEEAELLPDDDELETIEAPEADDDADDDFGREEEARRRRKRADRRRAASALKLPGICFIVAGALGLLTGFIYLSLQIAGYHPGLDAPPKAKPLPAQNGLAQPVPHNEPNDAYTLGYYLGVVVVLALIFTSSAIVGVAGVQMLRLRHFGFCYAASIVAFLPCNLGCWLAAPIAIWALIVLSRPEVRRAFTT